MSIRLGGNEITGNDQFLLNNTSNNNGNLLVFTNESDDNNNLLINFDNSYNFGFNNNDIILSEHYNFDNYYLRINNSNILFKNTNISNIFTSNYIIQDYLGNIFIDIDNKSRVTNFNNMDFIFNVNENNFIIKNDNINIINVSNDIHFNCNLYIDTIYCKRINPYNDQETVDINNFRIESFTSFSNITLDYTDNDPKLKMISNKQDNVYDILTINDNIDDSNIFSINNKGFIGYQSESSNSFIDINNINDDLYNIINYQGEFSTDKFNIDKYSYINIGSNLNTINNNGGILTINRNDERKNLDEKNIQNVNKDKPLIDLNIFYNSSNNYHWYIVEDYTSITNLFSYNFFEESVRLNKEFKMDITTSNLTNLFNNYSLLHENAGNEMYYIDVTEDYSAKTSNYYYFLTTNEINNEINFDYTKLKLLTKNNVSAVNQVVQNVKYNTDNLLNNSNQVFYDYKVFSWTANNQDSDNQQYYIIYPAYLVNTDDEELKLELNIDLIQNPTITNNARQLYLDITLYDTDKIYEESLRDAIKDDITTYKETLIGGLEKFGDPNALTKYISDNSNIETDTVTVSITDELMIYCKDYANITKKNVFSIHISKRMYSYLHNNNYNLKYSIYDFEVINQPNFINFTNNDNVITTINNNGSIIFGNFDNTIEQNININEYSIISPNNKILTSNIKTNTITSYSTDSVSFDNKNIIDIKSLNFSSDGNNTLNVDNIIVNSIQSSGSNITIYNSYFNYEIDDSNLIMTSNLFNNNYYNSIIDIETSLNSNIKPAISISGNEPSFIQKNSNYVYQTILKNKQFRKNHIDNNLDTKTCYEINFSNLINKNFEYNDIYFNDFNSTHILQHIIDDDIISLGENYNLCFYNGFFKSNLNNYSRLLSQNTSNSSFTMSLGVPYKNSNISDFKNGIYYYNYINYFNNNIKNNNYMLNIFGNTKISGIDGNTNALNVVIHDESNIDGIFATNIGIGKEPRIEKNKNILDVNGDIYTSNLYINNTNISNYLVNSIPDIINNININASIINDGIIDIERIPNIPSSNLLPPSLRPFINEANTNKHPKIGTQYINDINYYNFESHTDGTPKYYYNIFDSSSNIKIENSIFADILLIGGGGSFNNDKGGNGGDVIMLNNVDIINNSTITFTIGQGGISGGNSIDGQNTTITIFNNNIKKNITYTAYGGKAGVNDGDGIDINPNLAREIYNIFSEYSSFGFGHVDSDKLYFGGSGNKSGSDLSLAHKKIGSGGYYGDENGINGAIFIRYKFDTSFIELHDNNTLGILQYNWNTSNWSLNYDKDNNCNILLNKITDTSNILNNIINDNSNYIIHEIYTNSNLLIQETTNISNYIHYINELNSNYSHVNISNLYHINDSIFHTDSNYIIRNEKIPNLDINKLNNINEYYLYNPKVNNEIVNTTSYYREINSSNYIILELDDNDDSVVGSHKKYEIYFQNRMDVDILLVGAGGKGANGKAKSFHNGGGGGALIEINNLTVESGESFTIRVGKGGGKNIGQDTQGDGQDTILEYKDYILTAGGGESGSGTNNGAGGITDIPTNFRGSSSYGGTIHKELPGGEGGNSVNYGKHSTDGRPSDIIKNNDDETDYYFWGGGGGRGMWYINDANNNDTRAGKGGGGGGAFYLKANGQLTNFTSYGGDDTYFDNINNDVITTSGNNNDIINGADGINGTGGGGGGSIYINDSDGDDDVEGIGGKGGNGIAIIKFKNNNNISVRNGYLYYNFVARKWEVQSLNLLNLDIDYNLIASNIENVSNYLKNYIDSKTLALTLAESPPEGTINNYNLVNKTIEARHIFGYNGCNADGELIPIEDYTNTNSLNYQRLINGNKFQNQSITNDHIVDNTITGDKLRGKIEGSKLSNLSIDYDDIINSINSRVFLTNNHLCNIYFSNFTDITFDLSYFDYNINDIYDGNSLIITNNYGVNIPINIFSNIHIEYSNLDTFDNYNGILNLYSVNNDIDINRFSNVNINIDNLDGYNKDSFIISNINLNGIIPQNYINNIYVNIDNINSNTLKNANVYLLSDDKIVDNDIINHFNITYDQLQNVAISNVTITVNQSLIDNSNIYNSFIDIDNINYNINNFSNVTITFADNSNINSSNIFNCSIDNNNIDYTTNQLSNVIIQFEEGSSINSSNIFNCSINNSNIDYTTNQLSNVVIQFEEGSNINSSNIFNCYINNSNIDYTTNKLSNVNIEFDDNNLINAINIINTNINYNNIFFDDTVNKLNGVIIQFDEGSNINSSNIFNSIINYNNIDYTTNQLSNVVILGNIQSCNIANAILSDYSEILGNHKINTVYVTGNIDSSKISTAILSQTTNIIGDSVIDNTFLNCDIHSSNIGNGAILSSRTNIKGNEKLSNVIVTGEIDASLINNAIINLNNETHFTTDSIIQGPVTITGIVYSSNFDFASYSNQISIELNTGDTINGNVLINNSIDSTKLANNLDLFVDSITFDNGITITNLNDYYTSNQINTNFVSKDYHKTELANNIISNSNININLYNESDNTYSNYKTPFILNDNYIFIDSTSNIYTNEDYALLNIYDKNESANIYIYSKNHSLYNYNDINRSPYDNGSMIKFNNPLLSINLQNSNVMEFNINSNISYNDFKLNGNIIFSDNTTIGSGDFNSLYNGDTKQLVMNNTVNGINYSDEGGLSTGEGFIHCNGLHAEFDITAFSTTTSSDKRLKKDIKELTYDNEILKLNPVSFKWNDKNKSNSSNVGFIAQEIEEILPILVKDGPDDYKTVNYTGLIPYLVKHIQNLEERIKILENK